MTDIALPNASSTDNGFISLAGRITALSTAALQLKEGMHLLQRHMENNATQARTLSEMCDAAEVEPRYTAQILEVSQALTRVAQAAGDLASTADVMETNARGFTGAHQAEYRGIYEASNASGVQQAKPGFYQTR
jgi:hypothetical protein